MNISVRIGVVVFLPVNLAQAADASGSATAKAAGHKKASLNHKAV